LYAVFQLESVYANPTDLKYFNFTAISDNNYGTGWEISLKPEYASMLVGKITLPASYTNEEGITKKVVCIGSFVGGLNITHIFFMPGSQYVSIDENAFRESLNVYNKLTMVKFPEDMNTFTYVGNGAFYFCRALKTINLPDTVTYIGKAAYCPSPSRPDGVLEMNKLPASLKTIGDEAFRNSKIDIVSLPVSLTKIGGQAFRNCMNVAIESFGSDSGTVNGSQLREIGERAFNNSGSGLLNGYIILYNSVKTIGANAFDNYGGSTSPLTAYYTHATFNYTASDLGVDVVTPYTGSLQ
jgi:hypothetical protein